MQGIAAAGDIYLSKNVALFQSWKQTVIFLPFSIIAHNYK